MKSQILRLSLAAVFAALVLPISAETYTASIYAIPPGYSWFQVSGAGDNGMMTGYGVLSNNQSFPSRSQALYLTNSGFRNLTPNGWQGAMIHDSWDNTYHVGGGTINGTYPYHILFWIGASYSYDIHPSGYSASEGLGGGGNLQVGYVTGNFFCNQCGFTSLKHAGMWARTASSFSRLHSTQHDFSQGMATDGIQQVGEGRHRSTLQYNALLWRGPNSYAVNLQPSGYTKSTAYGVHADHQVGAISGVTTGNKLHAVVWKNTAASMVDLNPNSVFSESEAYAVRNGVQAGAAIPLNNLNRKQAILWHGQAATWTNLHARLPSVFQLWNSFAMDIDNQGNVTGYVEKNGQRRPVIWRRS